jgi:intraflagellar transport protein 80
LDFKDRVINMSMCYDHLIVTTAGQCYIYSTSNWNTPQIFDLKDSVSIIIQSLKYFCLVESTNGLMIYNYEGKLVSNPKIAGAKCTIVDNAVEFLNRKRVTMSNDIIAVIDSTNSKLIKFFEIANGKPLNFSIDHSLDIIEINLNQTEQTTERKIAFIDVNRDLYLSPVHKKDVAKISTICDSFIWHDQFDILSSISDNKLNTYYYPNVVYIDKDLI